MKHVYTIPGPAANLINCGNGQSLNKAGIIKAFAMLLACLVCQQLFAQPVITSFSPLSGLPGSTVSIYGSGFSSTPSQNIVLIGGTRAYVIAASPSKLTVQVPRGITTKPISVTVSNLTAFSGGSFITTYKAGNAYSAGTFGTPQKLPMNGRTTVHDGLVIDDFDGDGKPDIVVMGYFMPAFYAAYRNTSVPGNIRFDKLVTAGTPFSYQQQEILIADFNGDGKKDMLFYEIDEFNVMINTSSKGAISFDNTLLFQTLLDNDQEFWALNTVGADLNADGKADIAFYTMDNWDTLFTALNTGVGDQLSFARPISLPFGTNGSRLFYDFNGDGKVDILYTGRDSIAIRINTSNNGIASFSDPQNICSNSLGAIMAVTDINKDGKPDIATTIASTQTDSLHFLLNTSTSGNLSFVQSPGFAYGFDMNETRFVDIDGDGKLDIAGYEAGSRSYVIVKNTSSAKRLSFAAPVKFPSINGHYMEFGDFDGDGKQDMAYAVHDYVSSVAVLRNQTDTARGAPAIASFSPMTALSTDTVIINGDNFNGATSVSFGGVPAQSFSVTSNNSISAVVGSGSTGDIRVATAMGTAAKSIFTFRTDTVVKLMYIPEDLICSGDAVRIKAVVLNAYKGIKYTWYRNGNIDLVNNPVYVSRYVKDGDSVWCVVSFLALPLEMTYKSRTIKFAVTSSQTLKLHIETNTGTLICKGTPVTFKAITNIGDFQQVYLWQKNGVVVGDTTDTYIDSTLRTGDVIRCLIVRARNCVALPPADAVQMTVDESRPSAPVSIIGPDVVSPSQANIIYSAPEDANVRSYRWQIPTGASFVSGIGTDSVTINWSAATAKISVGASNACGVSPVTTKTVRVSSANTRIAKINQSEKAEDKSASIAIYPNPANNKASVVVHGDANKYMAIELRDVNGKRLLYQKIKAQKGELRTEINTATYAPGLYYVVLIDQENKLTSKRLMIAK